MADQISDSILDAFLAEDSKSRVAVETLLTTGQVHVAGEVTTSANPDLMSLIRSVIIDIGYDSSERGFDGNSWAETGATSTHDSARASAEWTRV